MRMYLSWIGMRAHSLLSGCPHWLTGGYICSQSAARWADGVGGLSDAMVRRGAAGTLPTLQRSQEWRTQVGTSVLSCTMRRARCPQGAAVQGGAGAGRSAKQRRPYHRQHTSHKGERLHALAAQQVVLMRVIWLMGCWHGMQVQKVVDGIVRAQAGAGGPDWECSAWRAFVAAALPPDGCPLSQVELEQARCPRRRWRSDQPSGGSCG